ncbi:MAG: superfamily II DNA/RNA helicase [Actinomycetes bacterium]|jgi:superfamily II DNA/RNA helicase
METVMPESPTTHTELVDDSADRTARKPRNKKSSTTPKFTDFNIPDPIIDLLRAEGIREPFPIQSATLPDSLAGRDVLGRGRTGSGKTLAFVLPVVTRLCSPRKKTAAGRPRAIILAPTRELANQINDVLSPIAAEVGLSTVTIYGGISPVPQLNALRRGVDIVVACPGRLLDHLRAGKLQLNAVEITVIDEADHMADLGFLPDVRKILDATPQTGQRLLFSATLDKDVNVIVRRYLHDPLTFDVDPGDRDPHADIDHHVLLVDSGDRVAVIAELTKPGGRTIVFTRTRHGATKLREQLRKNGVSAVELHGMLSQSARARNLESFTSGRSSTLVATDVAARGIHVDDVGLVIHADPPAESKAYLHRSGRTARAGAKGTVVTMSTGKQIRGVRQLTARAKIKPTENRVAPGNELLATLAAAPMAPSSSRNDSSSRNQTEDRPTQRKRPTNRSRSGWAKAKPKTKSKSKSSYNSSGDGKSPHKGKPRHGSQTRDGQSAKSRERVSSHY